MPEALPVEVDPFRQARQESRLCGRFEVRQMPRLLAMLASPAGEVEVDLTFERGERSTAIITGRATARVNVTCQRCLGTMPLTQETQIRLGVVRSEAEAGLLPSDLDPLIVPDGVLRLGEMIEDEIILGMPLVPRHDDTACQLHGDWELNDKEVAAAPQTGPFSVLKDLKKH
jgi:uncharacterized protein